MDSTKPDFKKVYGRGVIDTLAVLGVSYDSYKEIQMNAKRKQSVLQGLTTVAANVLAAVPISEPWPSHKILTEYERMTSRRMDIRAVEGCLKSLIDSGLVNEPTSGMFRKPPEKPVRPAVEKPTPRIINPTKIQEPQMKSSTETTNDSVTLLGDISKKLRDLASDLDAAAVIIGEQIENAEGKSEKFTQLQQLLKGLV